MSSKKIVTRLNAVEAGLQAWQSFVWEASSKATEMRRKLEKEMDLLAKKLEPAQRALCLSVLQGQKVSAKSVIKIKQGIQDRKEILASLEWEEKCLQPLKERFHDFKLLCSSARSVFHALDTIMPADHANYLVFLQRSNGQPWQVKEYERNYKQKLKGTKEQLESILTECEECFEKAKKNGYITDNKEDD